MPARQNRGPECGFTLLSLPFHVREDITQAVAIITIRGKQPYKHAVDLRHQIVQGEAKVCCTHLFKPGVSDSRRRRESICRAFESVRNSSRAQPKTKKLYALAAGIERDFEFIKYGVIALVTARPGRASVKPSRSASVIERRVTGCRGTKFSCFPRVVVPWNVRSGNRCATCQRTWFPLGTTRPIKENVCPNSAAAGLCKTRRRASSFIVDSCRARRMHKPSSSLRPWTRLMVLDEGQSGGAAVAAPG